MATVTDNGKLYYGSRTDVVHISSAADGGGKPGTPLLLILFRHQSSGGGLCFACFRIPVLNVKCAL